MDIEEIIMSTLIIGIVAVIIILAVSTTKSQQDYTQSCRDAGGVPIVEGGRYTTYNCWSNKDKGYIDVK